MDDRNRRGEFQERFHPLRIGTINASDRRRDPSLAAEYRDASDGNFLAIEDNKRMAYLVVPRFDLTVKEPNYEAGAIGTVFECRSYDPLLSFSRVMLRRPAVLKGMVRPGFSRSRDYSTWDKVSKAYRYEEFLLPNPR